MYGELLLKFCPAEEECLEALNEESRCPPLEACVSSERLKEELRLESQEGDPLEVATEMLLELLQTPRPPPKLFKFKLARMLSHQWIFLMALELQEMATP